jgi:hypothetical protein
MLVLPKEGVKNVGWVRVRVCGRGCGCFSFIHVQTQTHTLTRHTNTPNISQKIQFRVYQVLEKKSQLSFRFN